MNLLIALLCTLCLFLATRLLYLRYKSNTGTSALHDEKPVEEMGQATENVPCEEAAPAPAQTLTLTHTAESEVSKSEEHEDRKVTQNEQLIASLHKVLEEDKVFLRPDIHIEDVAKMLFTNRTYITQLMRQEYGLSFIEYVNVARIQHSQSLLYSSTLTLDEIAEQSGFSSASNYCRAFKRYTGSSPMNWLQQVKE